MGHLCHLIEQIIVFVCEIVFDATAFLTACSGRDSALTGVFPCQEATPKRAVGDNPDGKIKTLLSNPDYSPYFYYYESANYNGYYFKIYQSVGQLDTEKMGLSSEDTTLEYYQGILDNLKSRMGTDFADQIIIVTRFGKRFSKELKKYAKEIGLSRNMVTTFWAYDEIK